MSSENLPGYRSSAAKLVAYIVLYVVAAAIIGYLFNTYLVEIGFEKAPEYSGYAHVLLALLFGFLIVVAFANVVYWAMRVRHDHSAAQAVRNIFIVVGIGAMVAAIAGAQAGGAAGVALGGFIGMVIGFASQQVLGQAMAGLFLNVVRPFKAGDPVNVAAEEGVVVGTTTLFTAIDKPDGVKTLIPNSMIIAQKIHLKPHEPPKDETSSEPEN
jgi:small-conductance mechanosensitive channel